MEDEEVIATSDCEELEALDALAPGYWSNVLSSSTVASRTEIPTCQPSGDVEGSRSSYMPTDYAKTHALSSGSLSRSPRRGPPWKRPKVLHSTDAMPEYSSLPSTPVKARFGYASGSESLPVSSSPSTSQIRGLRELTIDRSLSPEVSLTYSPEAPANPIEAISTTACGEVASEDSGKDRLHISIDPGRPKIMDSNSQFGASPMHAEDRLLRVHSGMSQSRSPSPDPLSLFTPTKEIRSDSNLPSSKSDSVPLVVSPRFSRNDPKPPSPLTPISSPNLSNPVLPQRTTTPSSPTPAQNMHGADEGVVAHMLEAEQAQGRYSLRTRLARQRNPYAYDKAMYKRQMRSNPDAIVKFISPPRPKKHHRSKSRSEGQSGSGEEAEDEFALDEEGEEPEEYERPWRVRRQKSRSVSASVGGQGHNHQGPSLTANHNPLDRPQPRETWYPDAFNESFSSSSDEGLIGDPILSPKKRKRGSREGAKIHSRRRPFPMRNFKRNSPVMERHVSLPPQSPAQTVDLTAEAASDDEANMVLPRWRRRSMSRVPSHHSVSNSRSSSVRNSPIDANSPLDQEEYIFRYHGSVEPPPLSSTPTDFDAFLSQPKVGPVHDSGSKGSASEVEIVSDHAHDHQQNPIELSDESSGSEQSVSSTAMLTSQDRRRFKALQRMMPRVLIQRHLQNPTARRPRATADDHSGTDDDGQPLRPGQSRVRIRGPADRTSADIRGDSESSDIEMPEEGPRSSSSSSESDMDVMSPPPRLRKLSGLAFGVAGPGRDSDSGGDMDDAEIGQWVSETIRPPRRSGLSREAKEGDLIDRMLSRTRVTSTKRRRKHRPRRTDSRPRVSSSKSLHITTGSARKTGTGRQTLLPFARAPSSQNNHVNVYSGGARNTHDQASGEAIEVMVNSRKRKKQRDAGGLFTFSSGGGRLATGRSHNLPITIDAEEDYAVPPSKFIPNTGSRPPSKFRVKPSLARASTRIETALDDYWNVDDDLIAHPRETTPQEEHHHDLGTSMRRVTLDFDISLLPSGITFGPDSSLTRGRLHELSALLADGSGVLCPHPLAQFDIRFQSSMSSADFIVGLCKIRELACDMRAQRKELSTAECQQWQTLLHSTSQHLSWMLLHADETDRAALHVAVERHIAHLDDMLDEPTEIIPDDEVPYLLTYEIHWSMIETIARVECDRRRRHCQADDTTMIPHIRRFMRELWAYGFLDLLRTFVAENEGDDASNLMSRRIAELWVCLIHFIDSWASNTATGPLNPPTSFWSVYLGAVQDVSLLHQAASDLAASEMIWRSIFTLCSLSQFSLHGITTSIPRLGASWELISAALERIRLTADPASDGQLPKRSLHKRDEYIRMLVSRCFILGHRWRWPLDDASILFSRLLEIFKSRRFANLSDEPSDFPSFLRHSNLQLLSENKRSDTAFTLLLKLIVQAAKDSGRAVSDSSQGRNLSPKLKKLLSLCVPVGSVPFTKATPPTPHELSMLYNRFSAVAVAVYLEPTVSNLKYRLANARRYVSFKDTDHETRRACIRGLMHLTILVRHLHLPLDDLLDWLANMTDVLVDEYVEEKAASRATSWVVLCIQLLLGCVRKIIETPLMDPAQNITHYPDPALLKGPWVTRIFAAATDLTTVATTRTEIRKLVQAFLKVRAMVIPKPTRPRHAVVASKESQESQDDYGDILMDFDDPELLAALGDPSVSPLFKENKGKDLLVSEIIDTYISPAIYRLVCKHFIESGGQSSLEEYSQDADDWVICWVGCASVIVQNSKRDWSLYLTLGPHSWQRIIDPFRRRRVGLRFMLTVLQLDPSAYPTYKDRFMDILLESIVTPKVTIEHEYLSLLLSIDDLRHPLLHDMPCEREEGMTDYKISRKEFLEKRLSYTQTIFTNLADLIRQEAEGDTALVAQNQTCIGCIVTMLSTMQDNHQQLAVGTEEQSQYSLFCRKIHECLARFPVLSTNSRLTTFVNWGNQLH